MEILEQQHVSLKDPTESFLLTEDQTQQATTPCQSVAGCCQSSSTAREHLSLLDGTILLWQKIHDLRHRDVG